MSAFHIYKIKGCVVVSTELETQLANVQAELEALRADFNDYAYGVSHDLAAPFRQIDGFANIILSNHGDQFDDKTRRHFDIIMKGTEKGAGIVESLLSYSRIRTETPHLSSVDCNGVVADVLVELKNLVEESNADCSVADLPVIEGDASLIDKLFNQLIHNALLYNKPGSSPVIEISGVDNETEWAFSISDNGIGIPENSMENVFKVLKRAVADKEYPGHGMGLTMAKSIVQHHGGSIGIQSNDGKGCLVSFTIPKSVCTK